MTITKLTTSVDGVQVRHVPSDDEVCTARLTFGVGMRDEAVHEQGVLHALEHVVMSQLRSTPLDINAHVGSSHTEFVVTGHPMLVTDYLARLCRTLGSPPVDRLPAEAPILAAEVEHDKGPHHALLARRYGYRDLGSQSVPGPGPDGLREDQLRAAAERWFTAGNAFLLVDGPLPPGLSLPLRPGTRPAPVRVAPRPVDGPAALRLDGPACMASVLLPPTDRDYLTDVTIELVSERVAETVRHRDGLSYEIDTTLFDGVAHPAGPGGHDLVVSAEPPDKHLLRAVTVLVTEMRSLLREGPSAAELDLAVERVIHRRLGRDATVELARSSGIDALLGIDRPPFDPERARAITVEQVRDYLRPLEATLLVAVPDDPDLDLEKLGLREEHVVPSTRSPLPNGRRFRPTLLTRAIVPAARAAEVRVTDEGLHVRLEGETSCVLWDDVVGVLLESDHEAAVFAADGTHIQVGSVLWRKGDLLIEAVRQRVAPHLVYRRSTLLDAADD